MMVPQEDASFSSRDHKTLDCKSTKQVEIGFCLTKRKQFLWYFLTDITTSFVYVNDKIQPWTTA